MTADEERQIEDALAAACSHVDLNDARYAREYRIGLGRWRGWGLDWVCYCARLHPDHFPYSADGREVLAGWAGQLVGRLLAGRRRNGRRSDPTDPKEPRP